MPRRTAGDSNNSRPLLPTVADADGGDAGHHHHREHGHSHSKFGILGALFGHADDAPCPADKIDSFIEDGERAALWLRRLIWAGIAWFILLAWLLVVLPMDMLSSASASSPSSATATPVSSDSADTPRVVEPFIMGEGTRWFLLFLVNFLTVMVPWSYYAATHTPPGPSGLSRRWLPPGFDWQQDARLLDDAKHAISVSSHIRKNYSWKLRWCDTCEIFKPPRTHHCKVCNTCIPRMDHHCPAVGQCVGLRNHKIFVQFLGYVDVSLLSIAALLVWAWVLESQGLVYYTWGHWVLYAGAWISIVAAGGKTLVMFGEHFVYLCRNQTNIDLWIAHWARTDANELDLGHKHKYAWDRGGWRKNLIETFGPSPLDWFLPTPAKTRTEAFPHVVSEEQYARMTRPEMAT